VFGAKKKRGTKQLTATQADATAVPEATRQAVWDLFRRSFVNEFKGFKDFDDYLLTRSLLLFHDTREKQLQGFIIFHVVDRVVDGRELTVVVGDFFTVTADYRRQSTPIYALLRLCIATKLKNPFREMYYFFITYSFKSYLSFSRSMGEFYPCRVRPTPPFEQRVLDLLGSESAGDWGTYNPRTCVIESLAVKQAAGNGGGGAEEGHLSDLARSRPRDLSTTWMWFAQQNPNFAKGDCLCVLCSIDLKNMIHGAKNSMFRALGLGSKRMAQPVRALPLRALFVAARRAHHAPMLCRVHAEQAVVLWHGRDQGRRSSGTLPACQFVLCDCAFADCLARSRGRSPSRS
jgi:hypothetical protein